MRKYINIIENTDDKPVLINSEKGSSNGEGDDFYFIFAVGIDELKINIDVYYYRNAIFKANSDKLSIEITSVSLNKKTTTPTFRTTNNSDFPDNPYNYGIRIGNGAVKQILRMIVDFVEDYYNKPVVSITGERCTGASAHTSKLEKKLHIKPITENIEETLSEKVQNDFEAMMKPNWFR